MAEISYPFESQNTGTDEAPVYDRAITAENEREFICEAAVMYENGEPLPGYVRSLIKRLKSYET